MKKKNGFTLIELLAVIIILGILMIIAIPSVTKYISDSRKSSYVDSAKEIIGSARNLVNSGELEMYDTDATYYIDVNCIKTENAMKSPYGDFVKEGAYVVVTYDGKGYDYYWTSVDDAGQGVKNIVKYDKLDTDDISSDLTIDDISTLRTLDGRGKVILITERNSCKKEGAITENLIPVNSEAGEEGGGSSGGSESGNGGNSGGTTPSNVVCKRATSLHTATCSRTSNGCYGAGYYSGGSKGTTTITYGNLGTTGILQAGDAFDCDVNNDGKFDAATERFYYVTSTGSGTSEVATLIYYTNVTGGTTATQNPYTYYSSNRNWLGPVTAYAQLPSTTQWSNPGIETGKTANQTRQITNEAGGTKTGDNTNDITSFTYTNKAARLLTYQEVQGACGNEKVYLTGYLDNCNYLMENVGYYTGTSGTLGYWLESPCASVSDNVWGVDGISRVVNSGRANAAGYGGVRPTITVLKSNISY